MRKRSTEGAETQPTEGPADEMVEDMEKMKMLPSTVDDPNSALEVKATSIPVRDRNPIGLGTIDGSHGLFVQIFGGSKGIHYEDLKRLELFRRFPLGYTYNGPLETRTRRRTRHDRFRRSADPLRKLEPDAVMRSGNFPFGNQFSQFVTADLNMVNFIICPFLSTCVHEGALPLKQEYKRAELEEVTITAGLDMSTAQAHVEDNFANNPSGIQDIWNMEGVQNEHKFSTGINDCSSSFQKCRIQPGRPRKVCDGWTNRSTCTLPNHGRFEDFFVAVDTDENDYITTDELDAAVARDL